MDTGSIGSATARCLTPARKRGFLLAELIVSMALLGLIIAGLAVSMNGFEMVNNYEWARQRCTAAAEAQLDSLIATGAAITPQELQRLWPGVELLVTVDFPPAGATKAAGAEDRGRDPNAAADGGAAWSGLKLIQVTATARPGPRQVTVRLARYVEQAPSPVAQRRAETPDAGSAKGGQS